MLEDCSGFAQPARISRRGKRRRHAQRQRNWPTHDAAQAGDQSARPCFSGSIAGLRLVSMCRPSSVSMADAPMPNVFSAALSCAHQFQDRNRGIQSRHAEVNGQTRDVLVPHRNDAGADQHAGVVGERQSGQGGNSFRKIAGQANRQEIENVAPASRRKRRSGRKCAEDGERPRAHRHRALRFEDAHHGEKARRPAQVGDEQRAGHRVPAAAM